MQCTSLHRFYASKTPELLLYGVFGYMSHIYMDAQDRFAFFSHGGGKGAGLFVEQKN